MSALRGLRRHWRIHEAGVIPLMCVACLSHGPPRPTPSPVHARHDEHAAERTKSNRQMGSSICPTRTEQLGAEPPDGDMLWCVNTDGQKHGPFKTWYDNGQIESDGQFSNGVRSGYWRYWSRSGQLTREEVRIDICVFEKSSGRALENVRLIASQIDARKFSGATATDRTGLATLWLSPGKFNVAISDLPYFQSEKDIEVTRPLLVVFDLDDEVRRNLTTRSRGRLSAPHRCGM